MVRLSDLLGTEVHTPNGERLGRVGDVTVTRDSAGTWNVDQLLLGPTSTAERLGLRCREPRQVQWSRVVSVSGDTIIVRDLR